MDTISAFMRGQLSHGKQLMVFDWVKAARLIREHRPFIAEAGLDEDWDWTGGPIFADGEPIKDSYTYLASTWATPQICLDGEYHDCFIMANETAWNENTKWPAEALAVLAE